MHQISSKVNQDHILEFLVSRLRLDCCNGLSEHLGVSLGVFDLELCQLGDTLLTVRHSPLLLHLQLGLGGLGHLLECCAGLLLSAIRVSLRKVFKTGKKVWKIPH